MKRILTALQPSGVLHIGNYFGGIEPFVATQEGNRNFLFVVDYHAITVPQDPKQLQKNILFAMAVYLACGVDPAKTVLFQQSQVPQHTELAWILSCLTTMGEAGRMTQFKEKADTKKTSASVGLFTYPILMASDILLYDTDIVPVGADQKQHVELARDLAKRFNSTYEPLFTLPEPLIRKSGSRIMGLDDASKKMSKSSSAEKSYLSLLDDETSIRKKIRSAVTDSGTDIRSGKEHPAIDNLLTLFSLATSTSIKSLEATYEGKGYSAFKADLAEALVVFLRPLQKKIHEHLQAPDHLEQVLKKGSETARKLAEEKMRSVRRAIGVSFR